MSQQPTQKSNFILFLVLAFGIVIFHSIYFKSKEKPPQEEQQVAAKNDQEAEKPKDDENKKGNDTEV
ncbi:MAG: hypothetical protein PVH19_05175, partial [Planctomycetia bacterium]